MAKIKVTAGAGLQVRLPPGLAVEQPTYLTDADSIEVEKADAFVQSALKCGDFVEQQPVTPGTKTSRADVLKPEEIAKLKARDVSTATDFDLQSVTTDTAAKGK